ncbi:hypothetical protein RUM44_002972 [Polyplax serrata]|uniref:Uncharacterized protein n=1 Tax=Polyplax serrata TaxID=468196 RepID=A0ABR1AX71_POLSC
MYPADTDLTEHRRSLDSVIYGMNLNIMWTQWPRSFARPSSPTREEEDDDDDDGDFLIRSLAHSFIHSFFIIH